MPAICSVCAMRFIAALSFVLVACTDGKDKSLNNTVATYNAGLAQGFVSYATERTDQTIAAAAGLKAGLFCGQEIWNGANWDTLVAANSVSHALSIPPAQENGGEGCSQEEITPLAACVMEFCDGAENLQECAFANCNDQIGELGTPCVSCLAANIASNDLALITAQCVGDDIGKYVYGGSFGIGLYSEKPFVTTDAKTFESHLIRRGVLYAEIEQDGAPLHVFCTHLSAVLSSVPHPNGDMGWQDEQTAQISELLTYVGEKAGGEASIILGDFNTGPASGNATAELPDNYQLFVDAGYANDYVANDGDCTFCGSNPLINGNSSVVIDHILTKGITVSESQRVLTDQITVSSGEDSINTAYSDHYGVVGNL